MFIGEWAEKRGIRDQLVIATKVSLTETPAQAGPDTVPCQYTGNLKLSDKDVQIKINYAGNNAKSMLLSLNESLKRLSTSYIDIFYVHFWDFRSSIEEVMDRLHLLIISQKVLYLGISDAPAWVVATANMYAKANGKTPFAIYQGPWNVLERNFEREIIPLARAHDLALVP